MSTCLTFEGVKVLNKDTVFVRCLDKKTRQQVYSNVHAVLIITNDIKKKVAKLAGKTKPPSIFFIGIDSVSRLNIKRMMPKTLNFLASKSWIEYKGYNKVADNTFPNVMAVLTGRNLSSVMKNCSPYNVGSLDACNFIWKDFQKLGYITAYAEDEVSISTFNYLKKGFKGSPTDFYFRPYMLAAEKLEIKLLDGMAYCTGPVSSADRILNLVTDLSETFMTHPIFGFFWMNTFTHEDINDLKHLDGRFRDFFRIVSKRPNTIVVFLSDHGIRFGDIRLTRSGWLEERLPFLYIGLPPEFRHKFPSEAKYLETNANKLTCPYDIHNTLHHIITLYDNSYLPNFSEACANCRSLFADIEQERSCSDAGVHIHWCTCIGYTYLDPNSKLAFDSGQFIVNDLNSRLASDVVTKDKCVPFTLDEVLSTTVSIDAERYNKLYVVIIIKTVPKAIVEATITAHIENSTKWFENEGHEYSRLDKYGENSECVTTRKVFCYCHGWFSISRIAKHWLHF